MRTNYARRRALCHSLKAAEASTMTTPAMRQSFGGRSFLNPRGGIALVDARRSPVAFEATPLVRAARTLEIVASSR